MHAEIVELFLILLYFVPIFSLQPEHSHKKRISAHLYPSSATGRDLEQQAQLLYVIRDSPIIHGDAVALRVSRMRAERRYRRGLHDGPRRSAAVNSPEDAMLADSRVDRAIFMNCVSDKVQLYSTRGCMQSTEPRRDIRNRASTY